jgi:integrase
MKINITLRRGNDYDSMAGVQLSFVYRKMRYRKIIMSIEPVYWDDLRGQVKKIYPNGHMVNLAIEKKKQAVMDYVLRCELEGVVPALKEFLDNDFKVVSKSSGETLLGIMDIYCTSLYQQGKYASYYKAASSLNKISDYMKGKDISMEKLDKTWMDGYHQHCRDNLKNKNSTISKDYKVMNAAINRMVKDRVLSYNPLQGYRIKVDKVHKNKLSVEEIKMMKDAELKGWRALSRDVFLFSYYCRGMRVSDVLSLRWDNIRGDQLTYKMNKSDQYIVMKLIPAAMDIIGRYEGQSSFVFPIMEEIEHGAKMFMVKKKKTALLNNALKDLASDLGIDKKISMHIARHSFAALADRKGVAVTAIQQLLGHSSLQVTKHYLSDLRNSDELDEKMKDIFE